jgi:twitching motility protein PilI
MSSRKKEALRELQQRLSVRLQQAQNTVAPASWLAVQAAGQGFLLPLNEAGEIFSLPPLTPVPHAALWFSGVVSLRGNLHGVVDLARFFNLSNRRFLLENQRDQARLVTLNANLGINCAILIDQLAGLRQADQMIAEKSASAQTLPEFVGDRFQDAQGQHWQELRLRDLAYHEDFLQIAA